MPIPLARYDDIVDDYSNEREDIETMTSRFRDIITALGEDADREGLVDTPVRAAKAMHFLTRGYRQDLDTGAPHGPPIAASGAFFLEGGGYRTLYVLPEQELVILRLGYFHPDWQTSALPNLILAGLNAAE